MNCVKCGHQPENCDCDVDGEELPTAAYEWRYVDWEEGHTVLRHEEPDRDSFDVELELVDELVRRSDAEEARAKRYSKGRKDGRTLGRKEERERILNLVNEKLEDLSWYDPDNTEQYEKMKDAELALNELHSEIQQEASTEKKSDEVDSQ